MFDIDILEGMGCTAADLETLQAALEAAGVASNTAELTQALQAGFTIDRIIFRAQENADTYRLMVDGREYADNDEVLAFLIDNHLTPDLYDRLIEHFDDIDSLRQAGQAGGGRFTYQEILEHCDEYPGLAPYFSGDPVEEFHSNLEDLASTPGLARKIDELFDVREEVDHLIADNEDEEKDFDHERVSFNRIFGVGEEVDDDDAGGGDPDYQAAAGGEHDEADEGGGDADYQAAAGGEHDEADEGGGGAYAADGHEEDDAVAHPADELDEDVGNAMVGEGALGSPDHI